MKKSPTLVAAVTLFVAGIVILVFALNRYSGADSTNTTTTIQTTDSSESIANSSISGERDIEAGIDTILVYATYDAEYKALDTFSVNNYKTVYDVIDEFDRVRGFSFNKANLDSICYIKDSLLRARLIKIQIAAFPVIRKKYAENLDKQKWAFDISVYTAGPRNTSLILVSQAFENKANLQQVHEVVQNYAFRLRFKNIIFRNRTDLETFETNSATDNEL